MLLAARYGTEAYYTNNINYDISWEECTIRRSIGDKKINIDFNVWLWFCKKQRPTCYNILLQLIEDYKYHPYQFLRFKEPMGPQYELAKKTGCLRKYNLLQLLFQSPQNASLLEGCLTITHNIDEHIDQLVMSDDFIVRLGTTQKAYGDTRVLYVVDGRLSIYPFKRTTFPLLAGAVDTIQRWQGTRYVWIKICVLNGMLS
jgi:hypothetical protein